MIIRWGSYEANPPWNGVSPVPSNGIHAPKTLSAADVDWIRRLFNTPHRPARVQTRTYVHLMRCAAQMFEPAELERLIPRLRAGTSSAKTAGDGTEALSYIENSDFDAIITDGADTITLTGVSEAHLDQADFIF